MTFECTGKGSLSLRAMRALKGRRMDRDGYDTAFWWTAGIFAVGAITGGVLLRPGPLRPASTPPAAHAEVTTAQAKTDPALPG